VGAFRVTSPIPIINSISPSTRIRPSTGQVTVNGDGFKDGSQVWVRHPSGTTYQVTGETTIRGVQIRGNLLLPASAPIGSNAVFVQNPGQSAVSKANALKVNYPLPDITGFTPLSIEMKSTLYGQFDIYGTGFRSGAKVLITKHGSTYSFYAPTTTVINSGKIHINLYGQYFTSWFWSQRYGYYDVKVINTDGLSDTLYGAFSIDEPDVWGTVSIYCSKGGIVPHYSIGPAGGPVIPFLLIISGFVSHITASGQIR
jgi:hypothetical protein